MIQNLPRHRLRCDAGVAAVEFAFVAPLFLMLIFGVAIGGLYFATHIAVAHAASEGARVSVAGMTPAERTSLAEARVRAIFASYAPLLKNDPAHLQITAAPSAAAGMFSVTVRYDLGDRDFNLLAGWLPLPSTTPSATAVTANGGY